MRSLFVVGLGLALIAPPALGQQRIDAACAGTIWPDRLQGLSPQGDLVLASGRLAKLAEIRLPDAPPHRDSALSWLNAHTGQPVLVQGGERRDRWDRITVRIRPTRDSHAPDLGHGLVAAGLAMVDPGLGPFCRPELLDVEDDARDERLGLWADARYNPINVEHMDRLRDHIGQFVLVEGRIRSIGERQQRTYLNFGGHWAEDFTIIIPQRTWKLMTARGLGAATLKGQRIRSRGILQAWQGTALTIVIPEMIEHLEGKRRPR